MAPEFRRHKEEVDSLTRWPDDPVKNVDCGKFLNKFPPGLKGATSICDLMKQDTPTININFGVLWVTTWAKLLPSRSAAKTMNVTAKKGAAINWSAKIFFPMMPAVFPGSLASSAAYQ